MADIIATKIVNGRTLKQRFSERAWNLLGKDKGGWESATEQPIKNTIEAQKSVPGKEQKIENALKSNGVDSGTIENNVGKGPEPSEAVKEKFMKAIEGFSKGNIKDYFDSQEPPVEYNNKAQLTELKNQLAAHLKYDVIELQKIFS